jgi:hypothetical protein
MSAPAKTRERFIQDARSVHGKKYGYAQVRYKNSSTKVAISCRKHGEFLQTPQAHITLKEGCPKCRTQCRPKSTKQFIHDAKKVHKSTFDYSQTCYQGIHHKVSIICRKHGAFLQAPTSHLAGNGCKMCANEKLPGRYSEKFFSVKPEYKNMPGHLYVLALWNDQEEFFKIGITQSTVEKRFKKLPYNWKIVRDISLPLFEAYHKEQSILRSATHYRPRLSFHGHSECLAENPLV